MPNWGAEEKRVTNSKELRDVDMYVYTLPAGLLGTFIGRALRFRVGSFAYTVSTKDRALKSVEVDADSLQPQCEVDRRKFERVGLTASEMERVARRTSSYVLNAASFPRIVYTVEQQSEEDIAGKLQLRGETHPVQCSKVVEGPELIVRCPIDTRLFHVPLYSQLFGLLSVSPHVEVETRVPLKVLRL
ncbi:uncharacterized protein TM35_000131470 [Trypanosoma theileri]|uniref:Lipid/polyisoprenoid-binding YceI-like domain-containing protein n=1 Tax=Trypanosoma theileri TaxID=67003 RepID=A0A1X0NXE1_9TRYP|nr:uncharacterized protein TM35_000131470 [Trypanosoma theileri]ORC89143.1 hypothetical protein TM35_000131470 [Trypanosoma theileri]